jgi:formate dehydrogenase maturation protein FdhE
MARNKAGQLVEKIDDPEHVQSEVEGHLAKLQDEEEAKATKKYLQDFACPACGSDTTTALDGIEPVDMEHAYAHVSCDTCNARWTEEWVLKAIYNIQKGTPT